MNTFLEKLVAAFLRDRNDPKVEMIYDVFTARGTSARLPNIALEALQAGRAVLSPGGVFSNGTIVQWLYRQKHEMNPGVSG